MSSLVETNLSGLNAAIFPPNKTTEPRYEFSKKPIIYDHLLFLDFDHNGNCILGSSDVTGTFWEGSLFYFDEARVVQDFDYSAHYIHTTASDGKFVNSETIALAEDTGNLNILSLDKNEGTTIKSRKVFKVIDRIPQLTVWNNSSTVLCSAGRSISLWDVCCEKENQTNIFNNYHLETVNTVDALKSDVNIFASGGDDRIACIWDLRSERPSVLYTNEFSSVTSVAWNQQNDNFVIVGVQAGDIYLMDIREPKEFISVLHCLNAPVRRVAFKNSTEAAICGDSNELLTFTMNNYFLETNYRYSEHKGHVKDVKWYDSVLYSCGFGKCFIKHSTEE